MNHIFKQDNVPKNDIIFSTEVIEDTIDKILLKESAIQDIEFYELLIDTIMYINDTGDSVENYLYYWVFSDNIKDHWRVGIPLAIINEMAKKIKTIIRLLEIENPNLIEQLAMQQNFYTLSLHNKFVVLRF